MRAAAGAYRIASKSALRNAEHRLASGRLSKTVMLTRTVPSCHGCIGFDNFESSSAVSYIDLAVDNVLY